MSTKCCCNPRRHKVRGVALMEVLITILVFSIGMLGVFAMQIASKKTNQEAAQRSEAILVANNLLQRIQNSGMTYENIKKHYFTESSYLDGERVIISYADEPPVPDADCSTGDCTPKQLAEYDLNRWHHSIRGSDVTVPGSGAAGTGVPGLSQAVGCLYVDGSKLIQVAITWRAMAQVKRGGTLENYDPQCLHPDLENEQLAKTPEERKAFIRQVVVKTYL